MEGNPSGGPSCQYYMKQKQRLCKFEVKKGYKYCPHHLAEAENDPKSKRIPCPADPTHSIFAKDTEKHLRKCPFVVRQQKQARQTFPYVRQGINLRDQDQVAASQCIKPKSTDNFNPPSTAHETSEGGGEVGGNVFPEHDADELRKQKLNRSKRSLELDETPQSVLEALIAKVKSEGNTKRAFQRRVLSNGKCQEILKSDGASQKHGPQHDSLIGNLEQLQLLRDDLVFVEFGAGKGALSAIIRRVMDDKSDHVLIDRSNFRLKADRQFKDGDARRIFRRITVDIADLYLPKVPELSGRNIVACSKHLCGVATDLTLRSIGGLAKTNSQGSGEMEGSDKQCVSVAGVMIALCCHQRCSWESYINKPYMRSLGIGPQEFRLVCLMSSWGVCGSGKSRGDEKRRKTMTEDRSDGGTNEKGVKHGLSVEEREEIGQCCKHIINEGRVQYLRSLGFDASIVVYADENTTRENKLLVATPSATALKR